MSSPSLSRRFAALGAVFFCAMMLASCKKTVVIPQGVQVIDGTVVRADLSITRRGTHLLMINNQPAYYLESSTVNLHRLENHLVELQGIFEANSDAQALPVMVVQKVLKGGDEELRSYTLPTFGITLSVPQSWKGGFEGSTAIFTGSGGTQTMLRVQRDNAASLPFDFRTFTASSATLHILPLVIDGKKAAQVTDDTAHTDALFVDAGSGSNATRSVLSLRFAPSLPADEQEKKLHNDIIKSLRFRLVSSVAKSTPKSASGSVGSRGPSEDGKPCGGPAGILCSSGYYCKVTDTESDIGICKKL